MKLGERALVVVGIPGSGDACLTWSLASEVRSDETRVADKREHRPGLLRVFELTRGEGSDEETRDRAKSRDSLVIWVIPRRIRVGFGSKARVRGYSTGWWVRSVF